MDRMIRCAILSIAALLAILAVSGCNGTLTAREPRQELTVNPVKLDNGLVDVEIKYVVSNPDANPVTFNFRSAKQWDAWVIVDGKEVFRESAGKMYTQATTQIVLKPGESKVFTAVWKLSQAPESFEPGAKFEVHAGLETKDLAPLTVTAVPVL